MLIYCFIKSYQKSELYGICRKIFLNHKCDLENDSVVEFPQVQARKLLDLLQAVDQGIAVDEQLPGRLGHVQIVSSL